MFFKAVLKICSTAKVDPGGSINFPVSQILSKKGACYIYLP